MFDTGLYCVKCFVYSPPPPLHNMTIFWNFQFVGVPFSHCTIFVYCHRLLYYHHHHHDNNNNYYYYYYNVAATDNDEDNEWRLDGEWEGRWGCPNGFYIMVLLILPGQGTGHHIMTWGSQLAQCSHSQLLSRRTHYHWFEARVRLTFLCKYSGPWAVFLLQTFRSMGNVYSANIPVRG